MKLSKPFTKHEAFAWASARCSRSEQCRSELEYKLIGRGLTASEASSVCDRLEDEDFLSDARYACAFAHDQLVLAKWGRVKVEKALREKHISAGDIRAALEKNFVEEDYLSRLANLLRIKIKEFPDTYDPFEVAQRLLRYATAKGYESELVFRVIQDLEV